MFSFRFLSVLAIGIAASVGTASAATYDAYSNQKDGTFTSAPSVHTSGNTHSVWFSGGSNPAGTSGPHGNHFLFEWGSAGKGVFETAGANASLTGEVVNAAGQGFLLELNLVETADPGSYKNPLGADTNLWTFYDLDPNKSSTLTALAGSPFVDFDISLRGAPLKGQFGIGANDKDNVLGFSTWVNFDQTNCTVSCQSYAGDINIRLQPVPLPAGMLLITSALALLGATRSRRKT